MTATFPRELLAVALAAALPAAAGVATMVGLQPLQLTERPKPGLDGPFPLPPGLPPPSPPPLPARHVSARLQSGRWLIEARTRISGTPSERGSEALRVKMSGGFTPGAHVLINPGGTTEEEAMLLRPPFVLAAPLRFAHFPGETVLQLGIASGSEGAPTPIAVELLPQQPQPQETPKPQPPAKSPQQRALEEAARLLPAPRRERPLIGSISELRSLGANYVHHHVGIEAAAALLLVALLMLCAIEGVIGSFFQYSLCCFGRARKAAPRRSRAPALLEDD